MKYITPTVLACFALAVMAIGQHSANDQPLNFGTGVASDGESIRTAFPKIDDDLRYLFRMRDRTPIYVAVQADLGTLVPTAGATQSLQDGDFVVLGGATAIGDQAPKLLRYDAASAATVDNDTVYDGPGSAGRYIYVPDNLDGGLFEVAAAITAVPTTQPVKANGGRYGHLIYNVDTSGGSVSLDALANATNLDGYVDGGYVTFQASGGQLLTYNDGTRTFNSSGGGGYITFGFDSAGTPHVVSFN